MTEQPYGWLIHHLDDCATIWMTEQPSKLLRNHLNDWSTIWITEQPSGCLNKECGWLSHYLANLVTIWMSVQPCEFRNNRLDDLTTIMMTVYQPDNQHTHFPNIEDWWFENYGNYVQHVMMLVALRSNLYVRCIMNWLRNERRQVKCTPGSAYTQFMLRSSCCTGCSWISCCVWQLALLPDTAASWSLCITDEPRSRHTTCAANEAFVAAVVS